MNLDNNIATEINEISTHDFDKDKSFDSKKRKLPPLKDQGHSLSIGNTGENNLKEIPSPTKKIGIKKNNEDSEYELEEDDKSVNSNTSSNKLTKYENQKSIKYYYIPLFLLPDNFDTNIKEFSLDGFYSSNSREMDFKNYLRLPQASFGSRLFVDICKILENDADGKFLELKTYLKDILSICFADGKIKDKEKLFDYCSQIGYFINKFCHSKLKTKKKQRFNSGTFYIEKSKVFTLDESCKKIIQHFKDTWNTYCENYLKERARKQKSKINNDDDVIFIEDNTKKLEQNNSDEITRIQKETRKESKEGEKQPLDFFTRYNVLERLKQLEFDKDSLTGRLQAQNNTMKDLNQTVLILHRQLVSLNEKVASKEATLQLLTTVFNSQSTELQKLQILLNCLVSNNSIGGNLQNNHQPQPPAFSGNSSNVNNHNHGNQNNSQFPTHHQQRYQSSNANVINVTLTVPVNTGDNVNRGSFNERNNGYGDSINFNTQGSNSLLNSSRLQPSGLPNNQGLNNPSLNPNNQEPNNSNNIGHSTLLNAFNFDNKTPNISYPNTPFKEKVAYSPNDFIGYQGEEYDIRSNYYG